MGIIRMIFHLARKDKLCLSHRDLTPFFWVWDAFFSGEIIPLPDEQDINLGGESHLGGLFPVFTKQLHHHDSHSFYPGFDSWFWQGGK